MKNAERISEFTIYRLSIYKRCLEHLEREHIKTISSKDLAARFGLNSAQLRKDLAYFGEFGIRGMGYPVTILKEQILNILGLTESTAGNKVWKALLVGSGHIGEAILRHNDFLPRGFKIMAQIVDEPTAEEEPTDERESSLPHYPFSELDQAITAHQIDIAILAVAGDTAQDIVNQLVAADICAILNFVPVQLITPPHVSVRTVDLIAELQSLTYHLSRRENAPAPAAQQTTGAV